MGKAGKVKGGREGQGMGHGGRGCKFPGACMLHIEGIVYERREEDRWRMHVREKESVDLPPPAIGITPMAQPTIPLPAKVMEGIQKCQSAHGHGVFPFPCFSFQDR